MFAVKARPPLPGLLSRAVLISNANGKIIYSIEQVTKFTPEPENETA